MLILSRRVGEKITIGDEVTVTVLGVKGRQIRIGIAAPKHVGVHREEIYTRLKTQGRLAIVQGRPRQRAAGNEALLCASTALGPNSL